MQAQCVKGDLVSVISSVWASGRAECKAPRGHVRLLPTL